jgi:hypothetical protein
LGKAEEVRQLTRTSCTNAEARSRCNDSILPFAGAHRVESGSLTGTRDPEHMRQDLDACDFQLTPEEVVTIGAAGME